MMSLSPDECKWIERLAPWQQGLRCGLTGACADACQRCKYIGLRAVRAHAFHSDLLEHWPPMVSAGIDTDSREDGHLCECVCVLLPKYIHSCIFASTGHRAVNHNVVWLSPSHLYRSDPLCVVIWFPPQRCPRWWVCSLLWLYNGGHMLSQACIMNTHTCRPTLTPKDLRESHEEEVFGKGRSSSVGACPPQTQASGQLFLDILYSSGKSSKTDFKLLLIRSLMWTWMISGRIERLSLHIIYGLATQDHPDVSLS